MSIANELITRGWKRGVLVGADGSVCLLWAAAYSFGLNDINDLDIEVWALLGALTGSLPGIWNDEEGRSYDDVLRVAKEADEILGARAFAEDIVPEQDSHA